jgi:acetyl esterase/lipase
VSTAYLRAIERDMARLPTIAEQRACADALVFASQSVPRVAITTEESGGVQGRWFSPRTDPSWVTILYFHGGGYAFDARVHDNLIAHVALASGAKTFVPRYPLAPEHPYPAQLERAVGAYRWLLTSGIAPDQLVVAGDSAGGNLVLALLLALRERAMPMPALAVCLSPWVDITCSGQSMRENDRIDWVGHANALRWADWYCGSTDPADPMLSPLHADFRDTTPLYIQAGGAEILIDQIRAFVDNAHRQGAVIEYDEWQGMPHDFQAYGDLVPEAADALARLAAVIRGRTSTMGGTQ